MTALSWPALLEPPQHAALAEVLLAYVRERRWYRAKARLTRGAHLADLVWLSPTQVLAVLRIDYDAGDSEHYAVPLARVDRVTAAVLAADGADRPSPIVAKLGAPGVDDGAIVDALLVPGQAADTLLDMVRRGGRALGMLGGEARGEPTPLLDAFSPREFPVATIPRVEQTNSTATFGDRALLKVYRRLTAGINPELEVGLFLTRYCDPPCAPRVLGALTYRSVAGEIFSLGIVHEFLANDGDAFSLALADIHADFERAGSTEEDVASSSGGRFSILGATLGRRTGELHLALAGGGATAPDSSKNLSPDFAPEPLTNDDRARLVDRASEMLQVNLDAVRAAMPRLTPAARALGERLLQPAARHTIAQLLGQFSARPIDVVKMRIHGDLHLGQVLVVAERSDFVIIDFEGEPARPLAERRAKSSPLRDVMGMARSFDYAPEVVFRAGGLLPADAERMRRRFGARAASWTRAATAAYLRAYLDTVDGAPFIPRHPGELTLLSTFFELEKVIYEIGYELNNRPAWLEIPLRGLVSIVDRGGAA